MIEDFVLRALIGGLGVALVAGPLGCFIVWRRMAYFGDSVAHSAVLGVALGIALGIDLGVGILIVCVLFALMLALLQHQHRLATDTLLGILSHTALAIGMVAVGLMNWLRVDLLGYLFGDVLAVTGADIVRIWGGGAVALAVLGFIWRPLLSMTVHEEMARAEGVPVAAIRVVFMLLIALVIAVAMKIVGILLITSLLIVPAAAARRFARTPEAMAVGAALIGALSVIGGLASSLTWDTPPGPSVVVVASTLFVLSLALGGLSRTDP